MLWLIYAIHDFFCLMTAVDIWKEKEFERILTQQQKISAQHVKGEKYKEVKNIFIF